MPTDARLIPTLQDPNTRLMQRLAALESQVSWLQTAKATTVQPVTASIQTPGPTTTPGIFTYRGGRLWIVVSGIGVTFSTVSISAQPTVNGVALPRPLVGYAANGPGGLGDWPLTTHMWELSPTTYGLVAGNNSLSFSSLVNSPQVTADALFIEWPVA